MSELVKVFVWNEHTGQSGRLVPASVVEDRGEDSHDFWMWRGTREELIESALDCLRNKHASIYHTRCSYSVLNSLGVDLIYRVRDASGEYIKDWDDDGEPIRTPASNEAYTFTSEAEANSYCVRTTDRVVIEAS